MREEGGGRRGGEDKRKRGKHTWRTGTAVLDPEMYSLGHSLIRILIL